MNKISLAKMKLKSKRAQRAIISLQEDQLGALGLVLNMIVLWNTIYMEAALNQLRTQGYPVNDDDVARLSPLLHSHINMLGRYSFSVPEAVTRGELLPLRNPADNDG